MKHEELMLLPQKSRITTNSRVTNEHYIKIWEDIGSPSEWTEELDLISQCGPDDVIVLDLCTGGGDLYTSTLFSRALKGCLGHTVAILGPEVASGGSIIALSCREWVLDDTSSLMCHTSSYGIMAKDTDIFEHANFSRQQLKRLYEDVYKGFLTDEELSDVIKGTPFYFDVEQIADRLDNLQDYRQAKMEKGCNSPDCQECGIDFEGEPQFDLQQIISDAVKEGISQYEKSRIAKEKKASRTKLPAPESLPSP